MFALDSLEKALVVLFLVASMVSIGLQASMADLRLRVVGKGLLLRTLLANFVVVPVLGILLARWLAADAGVATAFVLLACTPGGISALQFTTKVKGAAAYAGVTACLLPLLAVFVSPLLLALAMPAGVSIDAPYARAVGFLLLFLVLPLAAGLAVRARAERLAKPLARVLGLVSIVVFVVVLVMLMAPRTEAMQQIGGRAVCLLLVLVLLSMLAGWLLGGPERGTRQVLAAATGMRNVALALALAVNTFADTTAVLPALIAFSALMVPPSLLLTIACLVADRRRRATAATPG
jgi:BASS family bile acid:Na+ symporter